MRNALVGSKLVIQHALDKDGEEPFERIGGLNTLKLQEIYLLIKDSVSADTLQNTLKVMKVIFENDEQINNSLKLIYTAVTKGLNITQLIMDYAKIVNEKADTSQIDLNILLKNIVEWYQMEWAEHKISIQLDLTKETLSKEGIEIHFESVYKNLLLNAKDALLDRNQSNGKDKSIEIKTKVEPNNFLAEITDNGCGIFPEHLGKIYDAFFSTKP